MYEEILYLFKNGYHLEENKAENKDGLWDIWLPMSLIIVWSSFYT